jgi:hypothetical protein
MTRRPAEATRLSVVLTTVSVFAVVPGVGGGRATHCHLLFNASRHSIPRVSAATASMTSSTGSTVKEKGA